ncbi:hypothetical protein [Allocoleopsis sp.]|uniref:hypothetical protein n=1 Tax=Allocoleopsis sp. TaxID=3088169 RepID=UPI002FD300B9
MTDSSIIIQEILKCAWENTWQIFQPDNSWKDDKAKCSDIQKRLSYFNPTHSDSPEHIDKVIKALSRGVSLTQAAIDWQNAAIGKKSTRKIDKLRGIQWRLVIAYGGFEITAKALMNHFKRNTPSEVIENYIKKCNFPIYKPLGSPSISPNKKPNLEKWLSKEESAIADFLGVTAGDAKIIERWIVKSDSIGSWEEAVKLAKALRNATAHGFLQPTKVNQWGLKPGLSTLADNLAEIMAAGLKKLT